MKKQVILLMIFLSVLLVSCKNDETIIAEVSEIEESMIEESYESEPDKMQSQSEVEFSSSQAEDHVDSEQTIPNTDTQQPPVYSEQALIDFLTYLEQSLTDEQHGGLYRTSDFNGSGIDLHGGPDKADPYIVVWVIDKDTVNRIIESYTGQRVDIVCIDAAYSMNRLNAILSELESSEIAAYINAMVLSDDNKVMIDVVGKDNQDQVDGFLQTYKYKDAVSLFVRPGNNENPVT